MEKRYGTALIVVQPEGDISSLNNILSKHSDIIIGRQGIPQKHKGIQLISIVLEGSTDQVGSLTGQLGRLHGINVKSAMMKS